MCGVAYQHRATPGPVQQGTDAKQPHRTGSDCATISITAGCQLPVYDPATGKPLVPRVSR